MALWIEKVKSLFNRKKKQKVVEEEEKEKTNEEGKLVISDTVPQIEASVVETSAVEDTEVNSL